MWRGDNDRDITSFSSLNIPVAMSHCSFNVITGTWQNQPKSINCSASCQRRYASCGNLWWT